MKKILLFFVGVLTLGVTARAADGDVFTVDRYFTYTVISEAEHTVSLSYYKNSSFSPSSIIIPSEVTNNSVKYAVTEIGERAFYNNTNNTVLGTVLIPNSVTIIGDEAFRSCTKLENMRIPNSVTKIGNMAFFGCPLKSVTIPESVTEIGVGAFSNKYLQEINVSEGNTAYVVVDDILYTKDMALLLQCPTSKTTYNVPNSVTEIRDYAFYECSKLTSITIPNSVTIIGNDAFYGCSELTSMAIPNSVTEIGYRAFYWCMKLTSIVIPSSVTIIGDYAFGYCAALTSVTLPNSLAAISYGMFWSCHSLTTVTIPESVISIGGYAFRSCGKLATVNCYAVNPPGVGIYAFDGVNIFDVALHVVPKAIAAYLNAEVWQYFNIDSNLSGIEDIEADGSDAPVEYFNLNGVRVNGEALTPGLYIKRQGGKATKVLVK